MLSCTLCKFIFFQTLLCTHWLKACPTMSCIHLVQLFVVLYACKFIDQMYQNYLQNKMREQLTISCGVVMTSSPLDSGSVRFSACENCCSDAICTPPSFDMVACLEIFCHFRCTYGGATWTNPLTGPLYFLSKKSHAKILNGCSEKKSTTYRKNSSGTSRWCNA